MSGQGLDILSSGVESDRVLFPREVVRFFFLVIGASASSKSSTLDRFTTLPGLAFPLATADSFRWPVHASKGLAGSACELLFRLFGCWSLLSIARCATAASSSSAGSLDSLLDRLKGGLAGFLDDVPRAARLFETSPNARRESGMEATSDESSARPNRVVSCVEPALRGILDFCALHYNDDYLFLLKLETLLLPTCNAFRNPDLVNKGASLGSVPLNLRR
mmetsp:Transcript_105277/g.157629  ORF Transcript_105277/g.157629 Transcript_105277/m.157629 type:complete len:220 (-) Transcript_105277:54-713(-)